MKISDISARTVTVPLEAPLRPDWFSIWPETRWAKPDL